MINTYTASPKVIDKPSLDFVGTGADVAIHGYGMYFGAPSTVDHYLKSYKHYKEAALSLSVGGETSFEGEELYEKLAALKIEPDSWAEIRDEWLMDPFLVEIAEEYDEYTVPEIIAQRGVVHEVQLRNIDVSDLPGWEAPMPDEARYALQCALLDHQYETCPLTTIPWHLFDAEEPASPMEAEALIDHLFDCIWERALEQELVGYGVDEEKLRAAWWELACGQDPTVSVVIDGFDEVFDPAARVSLQGIIAPGAELEPYITYGDAYQVVSECLGSDPKQASIVMTQIGIPGFQAPSVEGGPGNIEYVIFDQRVLDDAKVTPVSPTNWENILENTPSQHYHQDEPDHDWSPRHSR